MILQGKAPPRRVAAALGVAVLGLALATPVCAAKKVQPAPVLPAAAPKTAPSSTPLLPGTSSKEPINIDAGKLDYFDKEQKLIYTGDVVAVQGESTLKASVLTIFLQKDPPAPGTAAATQAPGAAGPGAGSSVRHMEADGPVTMISKDQVGTGDHATYDKAANTVTLTGNVTLSQGTNVTQGSRLVYNMTSGQAQVFSDGTGKRVSSVFTPGSGQPPGAAPQDAPPSKPAPAAKRKASRAGAARTGEAGAQP